ncbi:hypothetical protein [Cupriavidus basilensis]
MTGANLHRTCRVLIVSAALWIAGCVTTMSSGITVHTWRAATAPPSQPLAAPSSSLYTYVLVGDIGDGSADEATRRSKAALEQLIRQVVITHSESGKLPPEMLATANQFLIPAKAGHEADFMPADYNSVLAAEYVNTFRLALGGQAELSERLSGVGPFLIATRKPIGELVKKGASGTLRIDPQAPVLLLDMSGKNPHAVPLYVNAFKETVRQEVATTTVIKPLLPRLAAFLLDLDHDIPFVAEAYAGTVKLLKRDGMVSQLDVRSVH